MTHVSSWTAPEDDRSHLELLAKACLVESGSLKRTGAHRLGAFGPFVGEP